MMKNKGHFKKGIRSGFALNPVHSKETIEKIRKANTGKKMSRGSIEKTRQFNIGTKRTTEQIERIRFGHIGKKYPNRKKPYISEEHRIKLLSHLFSMKRTDTSIEIKIENELKRIGLNYIKQFPLCNSTISDFYLPESKVVIYADGDYWHNLPEYKLRDERINKILKSNGYTVYRFWEHEINKSVEECIKKTFII